VNVPNLASHYVKKVANLVAPIYKRLHVNIIQICFNNMPCKIIEPRICPTQNIKENLTYSSLTPVLLFDHHFNIFPPIALWPLLLNVIVFSMNNGFSSTSML